MTAPAPAIVRPAAATSTTTNSTHATRTPPTSADIRANRREKYAAILKGRYVTNITIGDDEVRTTTLTLDNGDTLIIEGNEGCMGCVNGWYHLENAYKRGNHTARIMNAHVEYNRDDNYADGWEKYTIFVMVDGNQTQLPLATPRKATTAMATTAPDSPSPPAPSTATTTACDRYYNNVGLTKHPHTTYTRQRG